MVMIHHSNQDYNVAASEAAKHARTKFEAMIAKGTASASSTVNHILDTVPADTVVKAAGLEFRPYHRIGEWEPEEGPGRVYVARAPDEGGIRAFRPLHPNGLAQAATRLGMSTNYVNSLLKVDDPMDIPWKHELLTHNLNELAQHDDRRFLIRSVKPRNHTLHEVRAVLSDKYRRLDSRPILDAFLGSVNNYGGLPCEGTVTDTKVFLKIVLPHIFEPVPNEPTCFGIQFSNSDYGNGKLSIRGFMLRLACTNKAITEESLSQVHLGRRLDENIQFSQQTYELDTAAMASAVGDIVTQVLAPGAVNNRMEQLRLANEKGIASFNTLGSLKKSLTKGEWEAVKGAFEGPDEHNLPPGKTQYRLSNAISWIAHTVEDGDRRHELEQLAGSYLVAA